MFPDLPRPQRSPELVSKHGAELEVGLQSCGMEGECWFRVVALPPTPPPPLRHEPLWGLLIGPVNLACGPSWGWGDGQSDLPSFSFLSFPSTQGGLWRTFPDTFPWNGRGRLWGRAGVWQGDPSATGEGPRSGQWKVPKDSQKGEGSWSPHVTE